MLWNQCVRDGDLLKLMKKDGHCYWNKAVNFRSFMPQDSLFEEFGFFIGEYTMEVDIMVNCAEPDGFA